MKPIKLLLLILFLSACTGEKTTYDFDLQGHRGARGLLPENSIPGFIKAVDLGVDTIELDVVMTRDSLILVSHEPWFHSNISSKPDGSPVTEEEQMSLNIFDMSYEETTGFDVGKRGHSGFPKQVPLSVTKPLMRDAILAIDQHAVETGKNPVRYNIEIKSNPDWYNMYVPEPDVFAELVYNELIELDMLDRVNIQSFDPNPLIAMNDIDPDLAQAILVSNRQPMSDYLEILGFVPKIWSPNYQLVTPAMIEEAHGYNMLVVPWTINTIRSMRTMLEMGVDGIITDYPDSASVFR